VIGTKGFGKTLLLKAKAHLYNMPDQSILSTQRQPAGQAIGDKIFSREAIAFFSASPLPWAKVWLAAVALAALKQADQTGGLKVNARSPLWSPTSNCTAVIDHFVRLLDFTPSDLQRCATDTDGHLVPRLRMLKSPLTIFIDGIDEYFNKHVEEVRPTQA